MALPYETASSGASALNDVQKILHRFGCQSFGHMMDFERGELIVQFKWRDLPISIKASINGYAAAWLREHPHHARSKRSKVDHEREAKRIASVAVYSIVRDWIKGQITAVETGILSFEGAFLGQILLPTGKTVMERVVETKMLSLPSTKENRA